MLTIPRATWDRLWAALQPPAPRKTLREQIAAAMRTSDPGRSIAPKEESMNPQHQDEARER